ncbi:MAG: hypothetical protein AABY32_01160 [Nanoarchaeota archaeon]
MNGTIDYLKLFEAFKTLCRDRKLKSVNVKASEDKLIGVSVTIKVVCKDMNKAKRVVDYAFNESLMSDYFCMISASQIFADISFVCVPKEKNNDS